MVITSNRFTLQGGAATTTIDVFGKLF